MIRDHSGYALRLSQWVTALHCNAVFHWLSPYPAWSLMIFQNNLVCQGLRLFFYIWMITVHIYTQNQANDSLNAFHNLTVLWCAQHCDSCCHVAGNLTGIVWLCADKWYRADSRFAPSQWKTALLCNDVSHWLGAHLESALWYMTLISGPTGLRQYFGVNILKSWIIFTSIQLANNMS